MAEPADIWQKVGARPADRGCDGPGTADGAPDEDAGTGGGRFSVPLNVGDRGAAGFGGILIGNVLRGRCNSEPAVIVRDPARIRGTVELVEFQRRR